MCICVFVYASLCLFMLCVCVCVRVCARVCTMMTHHTTLKATDDDWQRCLHLCLELVKGTQHSRCL